jgi:hypothetical protein
MLKGKCLMSHFNSKLSIVRPMRQCVNNGSNHVVETVDVLGMLPAILRKRSAKDQMENEGRRG